MKEMKVRSKPFIPLWKKETEIYRLYISVSKKICIFHLSIVTFLPSSKVDCNIKQSIELINIGDIK